LAYLLVCIAHKFLLLVCSVHQCFSSIVIYIVLRFVRWEMFSFFVFFSLIVWYMLGYVIGSLQLHLYFILSIGQFFTQINGAYVFVCLMLLSVSVTMSACLLCDRVHCTAAVERVVADLLGLLSSARRQLQLLL